MLFVLQARKNAKAAGQAFYDVNVLQALAGTLSSALPESLRPRACALSPHQVQMQLQTAARSSNCDHSQRRSWLATCSWLVPIALLCTNLTLSVSRSVVAAVRRLRAHSRQGGAGSRKHRRRRRSTIAARFRCRGAGRRHYRAAAPAVPARLGPWPRRHAVHGELCNLLCSGAS